LVTWVRTASIGATPSAPIDDARRHRHWRPLLEVTEAVPHRRAANSWCWAGLGNTYFWIDPASRMCGVILTQILPFADQKVLALYDAFETAVYAQVQPRAA
jgi:hypothetical protein